MTSCSLPSTSIFIKFGFGIKNFSTKKSIVNDNTNLFFGLEFLRFFFSIKVVDAEPDKLFSSENRKSNLFLLYIGLGITLIKFSSLFICIFFSNKTLFLYWGSKAKTLFLYSFAQYKEYTPMFAPISKKILCFPPY